MITVRNIQIPYDRTNVDDVERFENALAVYQQRQDEMSHTEYATNSARLLDGCNAAAELLRNAFPVDIITETGVNTRSLTELTDLIIEITTALMEEEKAMTARINTLAKRYGNLRS